MLTAIREASANRRTKRDVERIAQVFDVLRPAMGTAGALSEILAVDVDFY